MLVCYFSQFLNNPSSAKFEALSSVLTALVLTTTGRAETVSELTNRICDHYFPEPTRG
jgi:hypothetical protein